MAASLASKCSRVGRSLLGGLGNNVSGALSTSHEMMNTNFLSQVGDGYFPLHFNEGHPDKICDQVSDAILDACLEQDPDTKVACETCTKTNMVMVFGEITTKVGPREVDAVHTALGESQNSSLLPNQMVSPEEELKWCLDKEAAAKL